jgi:flagellar protein FlaG
MAIAPTNLSVQSAASVPLSAAIDPGSSRTANRLVAAAVNTLNQTEIAGTGREFSFSVDGKTKLPVVRIVDSSTRELIEQIPSQYILDLAEQITQETLSNSGQPSR